MTRQRTVPVALALALAVALVAAAVTGVTATAGVQTDGTPQNETVGNETAETEAVENETVANGTDLNQTAENATDQNETTENETGEIEGDVRSLSGDRQAAILAGDESAIREAGLANLTETEAREQFAFPARQEFNGSYQVGNATGVYDHAVVTGRNGTLQIFLRNTTVATDTGTTTLLNVFVAIGDNLSRPQLQALDDLLREAFEAGDAAAADVNPVALNATDATNATVDETANATDVRLEELGLSAQGEALSEALPDEVLDRETLVRVDVANVESNDTVTTYRNVLLRGTLSEVLTGQAATAPPERNETVDANVTLEREYFEVRNLQAPETVGIDERYRVNATVANPGDDDGAEEVAYRIGDERLDQELVRLEPGESTTVSFEINPATENIEPGTYRHSVNAFAGSASAIVEIGSPEADEQPEAADSGAQPPAAD